MRTRFAKASALLLTISAALLSAQEVPQNVAADAQALYLDLHAHPELSSHEVRTAQVLAEKLRALGYTVTEHVGGTGVVALLKNGNGPTVLLRTELDALPVEEKTGLPYASHVRTKTESGQNTGVMHACGHDVHMAALYGTAELMARDRNSWHGTLMLVGQPAEETISGAKAMVADGFFTKFPKPDYALALHTTNEIPAGKVAVAGGPVYANADSLRITVYGKGSHGSRPDLSVDPVLLAAHIVVSLQSIVARELKPGEVGVVTAGQLHAGTKNNIIPDSAEMGLTVRSYKPEVRQHLLAAITRIVNAEAQAANSPKPPTILNFESTDAVVNDPALAERVTAAAKAALGAENVVPDMPIPGSEDFGYLAPKGVPLVDYRLGVADPQKLEAAHAAGESLPTNHSPLFAPDYKPALATAIQSESAILHSLLK